MTWKELSQASHCQLARSANRVHHDKIKHLCSLAAIIFPQLPKSFINLPALTAPMSDSKDVVRNKLINRNTHTLSAGLFEMCFALWASNYHHPPANQNLVFTQAMVWISCNCIHRNCLTQLLQTASEYLDFESSGSPNLSGCQWWRGTCCCGCRPSQRSHSYKPGAPESAGNKIWHTAQSSRHYESCYELCIQLFKKILSYILHTHLYLIRFNAIIYC